MTEAPLYEPVFSREIETLISFDSLHVELRGARGHARLRLYLSRHAPLQTLQIAFLPDQADLLIGHLAGAVAAVRAGSAGECRASLTRRIRHLFIPDVAYEGVSSAADPKGTVTVRAEVSPRASKDRILLRLEGHRSGLARTWLAPEKAGELIAALAEANDVLKAIPQMD